jgi:2-polyprenyl-6-methoxyphenol hydroxylase-like FAD-dependent oxidoreductase
MAATVIIAGGGPVGIGLAIELALRGIASTVVERHVEPQPIPKGQNLTQRTMEHFRAWGVEDAIRRASPIPVEFGIGGLTAYGTLLSPWHYDWYQRVVVRPYYACDNTRLPQYATEEILRRRAQELSLINLMTGWTVKSFQQSGDGVRVQIESGNGQARTLEGDWLVGCDGSRSVVRQGAGITQTRDDHDTQMVLLVFKSKALNSLLARYKGKSFFNVLHPELKGYWRFFGRVDTGETWFFHSPVPAGTTRENFDFSRYLQEVVGASFDCTIDHIGFWDLRFEVANQYRDGRVFLAGDAAHSHPPYGGYGINTGFEDARNLGWKLAAVAAGWAGPGLLDTYHAERHPVFVSTARDFIRNFIEEDGAFLCAYHPDRDREAFKAAWARRASGISAEIQGFEPNYEGSPIVFGPEGAESGAVGQHSFQARAGHHLAPQPRTLGGSLFDALGPGFTLLCIAHGEPTDAARIAWIRDLQKQAQDRSVPLDVVFEPAEAVREAYGASLILVRPDAFVAWAGGSDIAPSLVIDRAVGWLNAP